MKRLDSSPRYRRFTNAKDRALEKILLKTRAKISDELRRFIGNVQSEVGKYYPLFQKDFLSITTQHQVRMLTGAIDAHARAASIDMANLWNAMRYFTYPLAHAGEQQAVIHVMGGTPKKFDQDKHGKDVIRNAAFGDTTARAYLALDRLSGKVMDAVKSSAIMGDDISACIDRVHRVFPKSEQLTNPRILKRLTESAAKGRETMDAGFSSFFADESQYDDFIDEYKAEFVPRWRDPRSRAGSKLASPVSGIEGDTYDVYPWQLEQELTDDFVQSVRNGENDGANAQGVTDFIWVAVLDSHTDECCEKRSGLTTAEIRSKLAGEWADDDCRAVVPAAHPNCRCRLSPATDDLPEAPESNEADFDDWLNS